MDTFTKMLVAVAAGLSASALVGCGGDAPCLMTGDQCTVFADNAACIQCTADAATSGGADPKAVAAAILACSPDVACVPKEVETKTPAAAILDCDLVGDLCDKKSNAAKCTTCETTHAALKTDSDAAAKAVTELASDALDTVRDAAVLKATEALKALTDKCGGAAAACTKKTAQ